MAAALAPSLPCHLLVEEGSQRRRRGPGTRSQVLSSMEAGTSLGRQGSKTASLPASSSSNTFSTMGKSPSGPGRQKVQYLNLMAEGNVCTKYRHQGVTECPKNIYTHFE